MPRISKRMLKLKFKMMEREIDQAGLAFQLCKSCSYVSERMNGKKTFSIDDAFIMCDLLDINLAEAMSYFVPSEKCNRKIKTISA